MKSNAELAPQQRIDRLERKLRRLQLVAGASAASLVAVLFLAFVGRGYASTAPHPGMLSQNASFDTLTVKRINVVGSNGARRLLISGTTGNAQIILADPEGRPRLGFVVAKNGEPSIELLDAQGKVAREISPKTFWKIASSVEPGR